MQLANGSLQTTILSYAQGAGATKADSIGNNLVTFDSAEATNAAFRPVLTIYSTS